MCHCNAKRATLSHFNEETEHEEILERLGELEEKIDQIQESLDLILVDQLECHCSECLEEDHDEDDEHCDECDECS